MDWVSVKDALPENTQMVWIAYKGECDAQYYTCGIYTGCGTPFGNWIDEIGKRRNLKLPKEVVTHWLPLPDLPSS